MLPADFDEIELGSTTLIASQPAFRTTEGNVDEIQPAEQVGNDATASHSILFFSRSTAVVTSGIQSNVVVEADLTFSGVNDNLPSAPPPAILNDDDLEENEPDSLVQGWGNRGVPLLPDPLIMVQEPRNRQPNVVGQLQEQSMTSRSCFLATCCRRGATFVCPHVNVNGR